MANLVYGGERPNVIKYNNADVHHVVYGGKSIWHKRVTVTLKPDQEWTAPANEMKIITVQGVSFSKVGMGGYWLDAQGRERRTLKKGEQLILNHIFDDYITLEVINPSSGDNDTITMGDGSYGDGCKFTTSVTVVLEY